MIDCEIGHVTPTDFQDLDRPGTLEAKTVSRASDGALAAGNVVVVMAVVEASVESDVDDRMDDRSAAAFFEAESDGDSSVTTGACRNAVGRIMLWGQVNVNSVEDGVGYCRRCTMKARRVSQSGPVVADEGQPTMG